MKPHKKKRVYTYYSFRVRFKNIEDAELIKKLYHTKNKNALVKNLLTDYLQSK